jgi:hypothetical protein
MSKQLTEYDIVRVVKLIESERHYTGSPGVARPPAVGDIATICMEYAPEDPEAPVVVECINADGLTIWLADFLREELVFVDGAGDKSEKND